jgi:superfamily II DNA/RNA helicase
LNKFAELGLSKPILDVLEESGFVEPTPVQSATIGLILEGKDVLASAQTGSGKTAAYALPIIERLGKPGDRARALVLVPTRELALQVTTQMKLFSAKKKLKVVTLYGGVGFEPQLRALRGKIDIIVATPGRLNDCLERRVANLGSVEVTVLDEADRLMDLGFMPQVRQIKHWIKEDTQTVMFSATIDQRVTRIASEFSKDPVVVKVNSERIDVESIDQQFMRVHEFNKDALLLKLLTEFNAESVLVFTRTKRKAGWVKERLRDASVVAEEIHGDLSQSQRERTLRKYRSGEVAVLVATDVAARGLDIPAISHVVNYDLPDSPSDYVHRIGRTGRAGRSGTAVSFISDEQRHLVPDIEKVVGRQLDPSLKPAAKHPNAAGRRFSAGARRRRR